MADLAQHAVQLTVWKYLDHPCYRFAEFYQINWLTPYLLGTFAMRVVAMAMPVHTALKLVVYAALIAVPLVLRRIAEFSGIDPWIALIGFLIGFGFTFYWGFANFNIVIPLVLFLLPYCCRIVRQTAATVGATALLALFIAVSHALACAFAVIVAVPTMLFRRLRWHAAAMLTPVPLLLAWIIRSQSQQLRARAPLGVATASPPSLAAARLSAVGRRRRRRILVRRHPDGCRRSHRRPFLSRAMALDPARCRGHGIRVVRDERRDPGIETGPVANHGRKVARERPADHAPLLSK
ncbi:MAG TPA: hypothetical protein VLV78_08640 [Thermoanaerobaculia bacterium]|nr:hypothetical protein [Thermoanaerobaculia bacterium]